MSRSEDRAVVRIAFEAHRFVILFFLFATALLWSNALRSVAQEIPQNRTSSVSADEGPALVLLNGPWKFHIGDDLRWADPKLDDSSWEQHSIDSDHAAPDLTEVLRADPFPGWQAHGHPGYSGYAWYRIRVLPGTNRQPIALLMPQYVDDSYEVYLDGEKIGAFGQLDGSHVYYSPRPLTFSIPENVAQKGRPLTIAIRFWNLSAESRPGRKNLHGGLRGVPILGPQSLLEIMRQNQQNNLFGDLWSTLLQAYLFGAVSLISFFLFAVTRNQREYLWAGISLAGVCWSFAIRCLEFYLPVPVPLGIFCDVAGEWIGLSAGPVFLMYLLGVDKRLWRRSVIIVSAILLMRTAILTASYADVIPPTAGWNRVLLIGPFALVCTVLLVFAIIVDGIRTVGRRAWAPLSPGVLASCGLIAHLIGFEGLSSVFFGTVPMALLFVFLRRFTQQQRENERNAIDMQEAQEVQKLLLPENLPRVAGFEIESIYLPAREVGGDFFQVLPGDAGEMLIVFGDVAGKGFPAAMLVSLLIGIMRTRAEETLDPASILQAMNDRLCGTAYGGFATCLAARISASGAMEIASAGHLPPYVNGNELGVTSALPLGVAAGIDYQTHSFQIKPDDRLMIASDGVVEAQNRNKELFGFERVREISRESAQQIAKAAQQFGQEDDITVLTVHRVSAPLHL